MMDEFNTSVNDRKQHMSQILEQKVKLAQDRKEEAKVHSSQNSVMKASYMSHFSNVH